MNQWNWTVFGFLVAEAILYALFTPVFAAFTASQSGFGFGVGYFLPHKAVMRAQRQAAGLYKRKKKTKFSGKRIFFSIRKHVRIELIYITGVLSFENAMTTALAYGALSALSQLDPKRIRNSVSVSFASGSTSLELTGIVSMPAGHIIIAAIREVMLIGREKISQWKSTRLKA